MISAAAPEYHRSLFKPRTLLIEDEVCDLPLTRALRARLPGAETIYVPRPEAEVLEDLRRTYRPESTLLLCRHRGRFFKPCPGTEASYRCCLYQILHLALGCNIGCSYCVLQGYLNNPFITQFVNLEEAFVELDRELARPGVFYRIGTGEFTDSLFMDPLTGLSTRLLDYFGRRANAVLEFKTKSVAIGALLDYPGEIGETIVSWSLNAPEVSRREEGLGAPLKQRLQAAACCRQRGYRIGLHFDPLLFFPGWEAGYREIVEMIFAYLDPADIIWISIGAFRFMPQVKNELKENHPASNITCGEFVRGLDGKQRYFSGIRRRLYRHLVAEIRRRAPEVFVYFCMEDEFLWRDTFGWAPADNQDLSRHLDQCCHRYRAWSAAS